MVSLTLRRHKSKKERALDAAGKAASAAGTFIKARIAWLAGKKAARVAVPAAAVGTAAVVVKKRSGSGTEAQSESVNATPTPPVGVA